MKSVLSKLRFNINSSLKYKNNRDIWDLRICGLDDLKRLLKFYDIKSKIHGPWKNQYGSINYYLTLNKKVL